MRGLSGTISLTYRITQGIIWGCLSYTIIKMMVSKAREVATAF